MLDIVAQRSVIADVYGYLKMKLAAGDAVGAANSYAADARDKYLRLFQALGTNMQSTASMLGVIANGYIMGAHGEMTIVRDGPDETRNGYPLRMTQDVDGVWRISEM